jgi:predicted transcriptional regulator with HTH domain
MEMLNIKGILTGVIVTSATGAMAWICLTLINVDKRTAITEIKVKENNKMITVLWADFMKRKGEDGNLAGIDVKTDHKVSWKTLLKVE